MIFHHGKRWGNKEIWVAQTGPKPAFSNSPAEGFQTAVCWGMRATAQYAGTSQQWLLNPVWAFVGPWVLCSGAATAGTSR